MPPGSEADDTPVRRVGVAARRAAFRAPDLPNHTPWQEIYRQTVGQLEGGGVIGLATKYRNVRQHIPRHSH